MSNCSCGTAVADRAGNRICTIGSGGSYWDANAGLCLMRRRWYDPDLARFMTRDPAGYVDGMSMYLYAKGNPAVYYDPWGLFCRKYDYRNERYETDDAGRV